MTVTWRDVARKDVEDAIRSKLLWGLTLAFVAFLVMAILSAEELITDDVIVDTPRVLGGVAMLAQLFIPAIAALVGYMAVVGERRSGSLRVLLSYPFTRGDIVLGKLVGRSVLTVIALAVGFVIGTALVTLRFGAPEVTTYGAFVAAALLLGLSFTALAVGASAASGSRGRAMTATFGAFAAMVFFWKPVVVGLHYVVNGSLPGMVTDEWYFALKRLNPLEAYRVLTTDILGVRVQAVPYLPLEDIPPGLTAEQIHISNRVAGEVPWYLQDWMAVPILLLWGVVPLAIGYYRFTRSDLG